MGTILVKISFIILLYVIIPNHQVFSFFSSDASHSEVLKETPMTVIDTSLCSATWGTYVYYDSLCVISYGSTPCSVSQRERERLCVTCGQLWEYILLRKSEKDKERETICIYIIFCRGTVGVPWCAWTGPSTWWRGFPPGETWTVGFTPPSTPSCQSPCHGFTTLPSNHWQPATSTNQCTG